MRKFLIFLLFLTIPFLALSDDIVKVKRVIDGDTFVTTTGERVRLIGVDTPETVHPRKPVEPGGPEASKFLKDLIDGKTVRLEYDETKTDIYGRTLAFVWLQDTIFVNAEIIRAGHSEPYLIYPFISKYMNIFNNIAEQRDK